MTAPVQEAQRFGTALALGCVLGLYYGFLRPLRPRRTALADLLFLPVLFGVWLYHSFGSCQGDLRLGYTAGLLVGGLVWNWTLGRLLRPVFQGFWKFLDRLWQGFFRPIVKIFKEIQKFIKFLFATVKKWSTINRSRHPHLQKTTGGPAYGSKSKSLQPDPAGIPPQLHPGEMRGAGSHRIVYGGPAGPAAGPE